MKARRESWRTCLRTCLVEESGVDLVEAALILPLLLTLLLGIVSFGRAYNVYETITRAAREGARYAVLPSSMAAGNAYPDPPSGNTTSSNTFQNYIAPALRASSLDPTKVQSYTQTTAWLNSGDDPQQCGVTISFTFPYQLVIPFTSVNLTTINIPVEVHMRRENQPGTVGGAPPTCP